LEARWERAWRRFFARQERSVIAALEGKRGAVWHRRAVESRDPADLPDIESLFRRAFWSDETLELTEELFEAVVVQGAGRVSQLFGVSFDLAAEWVDQFIRLRSNQLAGPVTDTTYRAIQNAMSFGVSEGETIPQLADRIRDVFGEASNVRATTIARTEVISAFNGSAHEAAAQLPADVVGAQEWIATRDGRTRPEHAAADGQVVQMGFPFSVGGEGLPYPGGGSIAGNNINCRCTIAFLTPDEYAAHLTTMQQQPPQVPAAVARVALALTDPGRPFDPAEFRTRIMEVAS
jgi:SPP1 gp7 family putative phage head morphogenesis protein